MFKTELITGSKSLILAKSGPTKNYPSEIKKLQKTIFRDTMVNNKTPLDYLGKYDFIKGNLKQEILWSANIIKAHREKINSFISKRKTFENLIINKKHSLAEESLNEIEREHGFSLWMIEAKVSLLQIKDGLDAQKSFISTLYNKRKSADGFDIVFYLSFLISQRNEPLVRPDGFISGIKKQLGVNLKNESQLDKLWLIVRYFIFGENIVKDEEIAYLLSWICSLSIYDLYDFNTLSVINLIQKKWTGEKYIEIAIKCLEGINDTKALNIIEYCEKKNNNHKKINQKSFTPENKLYIELLCHNKENMLENNEDTLTSDFVSKMRDFFQANNTRRDSFEWLRKTYFNFKHISTIYSMYEISKIIIDDKNGQQDAFVTSFLSPQRQSLYTVMKLEEEGIENNFTDTNLNQLYKNICLLFDENNHEDGKFSKKPELIKNTKLLLTDIIFVNLTIKSLIRKSSFTEAFKFSVDSYLNNKNYIDILPLEELVKDRKWIFYQKLDNYCDAAIIISLYLQSNNTDDKQKFNMKACCQTFINENNVSYHHLLDLKHFKNDEKRAMEFLSKVCTPEILEIDTPRYKSARSVLDERIRVCEKTLNISFNKKIEDELLEIKRKIAVSDGLKTADTRGITVDFKGFSIIASKKIKDNYLRYRAFLDAGINKEVVYSVEGNNSLIYNPNQESDQIVIGLLSEISYIFLSHHEYGLDYYLSMRIRHGRFIGILRGPLEQRKLITKYSSELGMYAKNSYWSEIYENMLSNTDMEKLQRELSLFSTSFDNLIKKFIDEKIQIKNEKKPNGLYTIPVTTNLLEITKKTIKDSMDFDSFLKNMFDAFLLHIESCSREVQRIIKKELKHNIREIIMTLYQNVSKTIPARHQNRVINNIFDELNHLRKDIDSSINNILNWFETSTYEKQDISFYTFPQLIDIGLARTKQTRLHFSPNLILEFNESGGFIFEPSILPLFSDLFSILFDNISDHNGISNNIDVNIKAEVTNTSRNQISLLINVKNKSIVTEQKTTTIDLIKDDIKNHNIRSRQEGNSGYHKIKAMGVIKNEEDLDFGFDDDCFYTNVVITLELHYFHIEGEEV
ncbi:hypothetical protein [Erwinia persicina]